MVEQGEPRFPPEVLLVRTLLRRASDLARFHCGAELDLDYRQWIERAAEVREISSELRRYDWERYSQRQNRRMKLGGLVGEVEFAGEWESFVPLLRLGAAYTWAKGQVWAGTLRDFVQVEGPGR